MKKRPRTFESLSEYLDHCGLTQSEFAASFGISVGYLSDLKNGKVGPSLALAKRFRDECHIPIESFLDKAIS
jgi:transcriptional regulator with XRE-family HTH domain